MDEATEAQPDMMYQAEPHLRDYFRVLYTRRWTIILVVVPIIVITLLMLVTTRKQYRSSCRVLLQPTRNSVMSYKEVYDSSLGAGAGSAMLTRQFLETQYRLILSKPILEATFYKMGFDKKEEYKDSKNPMDSFAKRFNVSGVRNSFLADVTFEWYDAKEAHDTLAYLVEQYILSCRKRSAGVTEGGLEELRRKAEQQRPKVQAKTDELQKFMADHNMVSLEKGQNIIVERLNELSRNLTKSETARIEAESKYLNIRDMIGDGGSPDEMPEVMGSETIRDLKLEYIRLKLHAGDLQNSLGPNHPEVKSAEKTLEIVGERLVSEAKSVLASAKAEYLRAQMQETQLRAALVEQEKVVMEYNTLAAHYRRLKDDFEATNKTYRDVKRRIEEIEISMMGGTSDDGVFVEEKADIPDKAAKPRKKMVLAIAGFLSLLFGVGLAFFVEYLDTSIKSKEDAEAVVRAPLLGYVPAFQNGKARGGEKDPGPLELMALKNPRSPAAESFRSIRTSLSFMQGGEGCRQFVVTSALPSEGKTLVSVNIALALAQTGKKVLIVDADLRRPRLHKVFKVNGRRGLSNLLAGHEDVNIEELTQATPCENLAFIASGPIPPNPSELLGSARMAELVGEFAKRFDYVIFDTPPSVNVTDAAVLGRYVDGNLLVVRSFSTDRHAAARARDLIRAAGTRMLGVVLNGVDAAPRGYSYYGYYYYGKYYGHDRKTDDGDGQA